MKRSSSLRARMTAVTVFMLAVVGAATLYTGFATGELSRSLGLLFRRNQLIEDIRAGLDGASSALSGYLSSRSEDYLASYRRNAAILVDRTSHIERRVHRDEIMLLQRQLAGLVGRFLLDADAAVAAKASGHIATFAAGYESAVRTVELSQAVIERIERRNLSASIVAYSGFESRIGSIVATNAVLALAAALLAFTVYVHYVWGMTGTLSTLADSARAIARGDYGRELPRIEAAEELVTMAEAFEEMRRSVRSSFDELKSKAEMERRLIEEDLRLVDMDRKLKDAELLALQAQINPHFLYNTLNAGMQLALVERAKSTGEFMEKLGLFIRYALRSPSRSVVVADEIACVERYVWLLRLRFGERFAFVIRSEADALAVKTPALVLQPLVENAVTHGFKGLERGGEVRVSARVEGGEVLLAVEDTGTGMDEATLAGLEDEGDGTESIGEGGIGLRNVMRRVRLASGGKGRVVIDSASGRGTTVCVHLPLADGAS
ncbi:MAG: sensor histidine kinase [Spirochaetales bacterium]|nr:sensor histidine kinase [Spirochaetales bacterium]